MAQSMRMQKTRRRRSRRRAAAIGAALALALTGCGKSDPPTPAAADRAKTGSATAAATAQPGKPAQSSSATQKFNSYIEGYNRLVGTFGLRETYERYRDARIANAKVQASINISDGWIDLALGDFKKARADGADGLKELDQAADALIPTLQKLVTELKEIKLYYTSKAYREDNLAKGKQQNPILLADFETALRQSGEFETVLTRVQHEREQARLADLKARGNMLGFQSATAMTQGEALASIFKGPQDVKNPALFQKADATVAELEQTLAAQRSEYENAKTAAAAGKSPDSSHESLATHLTEMIGDYRDFKVSKTSADHKRMIDKYNRAVSSANSIRR